MRVLFGSFLDCLVIVLFEMVRRGFPNSVYPTTVPANFINEWEISLLWRCVIGVAVKLGPVIGCWLARVCSSENFGSCKNSHWLQIRLQRIKIRLQKKWGFAWIFFLFKIGFLMCRWRVNLILHWQAEWKSYLGSSWGCSQRENVKLTGSRSTPARVWWAARVSHLAFERDPRVFCMMTSAFGLRSIFTSDLRLASDLEVIFAFSGVRV